MSRDTKETLAICGMVFGVALLALAGLGWCFKVAFHMSSREGVAWAGLAVSAFVAVLGLEAAGL